MTTTLARRITLAASLIGLSLISGLGAVSYRVTQDLVHGQLLDTLEYSSQRLADEVSHRINILLDHQRNLAGNTLMANALVDDLGRERYLPGFLNDMQMVGVLPVAIQMTNFLGQVIAHNGDSMLHGVSEERIAEIVEQGRFQAVMDLRDPDDPRLVLVRPIIFANTGLAEGALVYEVSANLLLPDEKQEGFKSELELVGHANLVIRVAGEPEVSLAGGVDIDRNAPTTRTELALHDGNVIGAELFVGGNPRTFREAERKLLASYLLIAVLALLLILVLSRQLARYLTSGLRLLQSGAEEIVARQSFTQRLDVSGNDEVARVGRAFNSVLDRLETAYHQLEVRAYEALRQKDEKYRAVVQQAGEGLLLFDRDLCILEANHSTYELLGSSPEALIGRPVTGLLPRAMGKSLDKGGLTARTFETDMSRADGSRVPVEITSGVVMVDGERHFLWLFRDITERRAANAALLDKQRQLESLAYHDALTELPNRYLFSDRVEHAMAHSKRNGTMLALCYLDLDGFKAVNDTLGHELGDRLLVSVSQRLTSLLRREDTVARLGGDEFVLLLGDIRSPGQLKEVLRRILEHVARPYVIAEKSCTVSASIGVTLYPDDDQDVDTLVRHADQAMYQAKQQGRNRYHLFDLQRANEAVAQHSMVQEVVSAIEHDQLRLFYQPKVDMRAGRVFGVEALVRWQHPQRGLLEPGEFLPVVSGLPEMQHLDWWVLEHALKQANQWRSQGIWLQTSINIAAQTVQQSDFVDRLSDLMARYPELARQSIELELLESEAVSDLQRVSQVIGECHALGVSFALDDFGTGYSSLTYYRHLPAKVLKLDRSFVAAMLHDSDDLNIVEGVIGLARAFGREVIAEGVESEAHGVLLMRLGCGLAQGFGIARPLPEAELRRWLENYRTPESWRFASAQEWSAKDLPLFTMEVHHRNWVNQVLAHARGLAQSKGLAVEDHHQCRFGRWYYDAGLNHYGHLASFKALAEPHRKVHQAAFQLLSRADADELSRNRLEARLLEAQKGLLHALADLKREALDD